MKAQYDLDREVAKTSELSSGELKKYGEDLEYKPDVIQKKNLSILHLVKFLIKD